MADKKKYLLKTICSMNKMSGTLADFSLIREDGSRIVIGYGLKEAGDGLYEWYEVYLYKKQTAQVSFEMVKETVIKDIDAKTDAKILNGYPFTPDGAEEPIIVWLSKESQTNFSEAQRLQIVPVKFKLNETADKEPIYHTFETTTELDRFYLGGVAYIQQCLQEGWAEKDSIDWEPYEKLFPTQTQAEQTE